VNFVTNSGESGTWILPLTDSTEFRGFVVDAPFTSVFFFYNLATGTAIPLVFSTMKTVLVFVIHLLANVAKCLGPGGARAVVAENLLLKHQMLILSRSRRRAPIMPA